MKLTITFGNLREQTEFCSVKTNTRASISLTCTMRPMVSSCKISSLFSKFLEIQTKYHKLLNQYQACLYLFECIFHDDSKYSHQIHKCWHFLQFCEILDLSSTHAYHMVSINVKVKTKFCYRGSMYRLISKV